MGASILICPVGAARARARSLERAVILESFVPRAISRAYWVTAGPKLTSTTRALMPKLSKVRSIISAFCFMSHRSAFCPGTEDKRESGGYSQTLSAVLRLVMTLMPRSAAPVSAVPLAFLPIAFSLAWISFSIGVLANLGMGGGLIGSFSTKRPFLLFLTGSLEKSPENDSATLMISA